MSSQEVIFGMSISVRLVSLLASVAVHAAVLMSIPMPIGETDTGTAESQSAMHVSVQRIEPADTVAKENPSPETSEQKQVTPQQEVIPVAKHQKELKEKTKEPDLVAKKILVAKESNKQISTARKAEEEDIKPEPQAIDSETADNKKIDQPKQTTPKLAASSNSSPATNKKGTKPKVTKPMQIASLGKQSKLSRDYRSTILRLIERYKYYPLRAKRKGIEGKTTVSFVVRKNGEIENIAIAQSSDKSILDQAAINTITRIGNAPPFPSGVNRSQWKFAIPITYNLK